MTNKNTPVNKAKVNFSYSSNKPREFLYYFSYYHPKRSKFHDQNSKKLLDFKDGEEYAFMHFLKWLKKYCINEIYEDSIVLEPELKRIVFNIIHPLSSKELIAYQNSPLSRICRALEEDFNIKSECKYIVNHVKNAFKKKNHVSSFSRKRLSKKNREEEIKKANYEIHSDLWDYLKLSSLKGEVSSINRNVNIIMIDDIFTTGTTMSNLSKLLADEILNEGINVNFYYLTFLKTKGKLKE